MKPVKLVDEHKVNIKDELQKACCKRRVAMVDFEV
jgi:hypothetical protein